MLEGRKGWGEILKIIQTALSLTSAMEIPAALAPVLMVPISFIIKNLKALAAELGFQDCERTNDLGFQDSEIDFYLAKI